MLKLPVTEKTFTKGLTAGQGELELTFTGSSGAATALLPDQPFPDEARTLIAAAVAGSAPKLKFGSDGVVCTASFAGGANVSLTLARAGDDTPLPPGAPPLEPDRLGVLLSLGAHAQAAAGATIAAPAGFSFGLSAKAGANVVFERYLEFARTAPARAIAESILSDIRLPQARSSVADLPAPGEVVQFAYSGFLELAAALNWGYSLTASDGLNVRDLDLRLDYALRAKAAVTLGYRLAGDYTFTLTRGHADGWARLVVRKQRNTHFAAAAGFDFTARAAITGFKEAPNEFLAAFVGTDLESVLDALDKAADVTDLDALEQKVGKLLSGLVIDLAERWTGGLIDSAPLAVVLTNIGRAVDAYKSLDARIVHTVIELYEKTLGPRKDVVERALQIVAGLSGREDLRTLTDQNAWALIQQIVGGDVHTLTAGDSAQTFTEIQLVAGNVLRLITDPEFETLRDVVAAAKTRLALDELFGSLERVRSAKDVREIRDTTLQGLVERIVGRSFEQIRESVGDAAKEINKTVTGIKAFKDRFAASAHKALHQSVELSLNFQYARATAEQALIDVEIDVGAEGGAELFASAASGRIGAVLTAAMSGRHVRVHDARLTHGVTQSSQLQFNILGWQFRRLFEVVTHTEIALQSHAGGLVQVFATEAVLKQLVESGNESMQATLLLRMVGETFGDESDARIRDYLIRTLDRMSVGYDLITSDDMTDVKELTQYLALGRHLGLVSDGLLSDLAQQFGTRLGKVKATYTVRFDHAAVHGAFVAVSGQALEGLVRTTARRLVASALMRRDTPHQSPIGVAYLRDDVFARHARGTLESVPIGITMPGFLTGGRSLSETIDTQSFQMTMLAVLYRSEDTLARAFTSLDSAIDRARHGTSPVTIGELEAAARAVLEAGGGLDRFGALNTFFGIFDALVRVGSHGKAHRESALVLEITPPGGETVTRFFMDHPL
jgi:hypothetical protein